MIFNRNYKKVLILSSLIIILYLNFITFGNIINENVYSKNYNDETDEFFQNDSIRSQDYYEENFDNIEWLKNNTFDPPVTEWYNTTEGDITDVNASLSPGVANYEVLGNQYIFSDVSGTPQAGNWVDTFNPSFPVKPDTYIINEEGCRIEHTWDENVNQTRNTPSARWKRNIELPINMSDYFITSASISAKFNASVVTSPAHNGIETPADGIIPTATGDYARFYVLISDLDGNQEYQVAYNQTRDLGQDSPPIPTYADTLMNSVPEDVLIAFLTSVLSYDNFNFSVILGIDIYCEDNIPGVDVDRWTYLIIREVNLTFTCQKKMDKFTSVSWCQDGDKISGTNVVIKNATLNFKYKIDQNWTESSPNSEIRILINNLLHSETVKLSTANASFQDAKIGGFDVSSLIPINENINTTIQLYLADTFALDQKVNISIDDVYLKISYKIITIGEDTDFVLFLNGENKTLGKFIKVPYGDPINITMKYINLSRDFIPGADVTIDVEGDIKNLDQNIPLEHYNITLDTVTFSLGEHVFRLYAHKEGYNPQEISITIEIIERTTFLDEIHLNQTLTKIIAFPYGEPLNITVAYKDNDTKSFIDGAAVQLYDGEDLKGTFDPQPIYEQYNLTINTADIGIGSNLLTIYANKDNYSASFETIITVIEMKTELHLEINGSEIFYNEVYELQVNQSILLTVNYTDYYSGDHIGNANVSLTGAGLSENLTENIALKHYNITLHAVNLTKGFNFLTIIAQKEDIMPQAISFSINLIERKTNLKLFINETDITTTKTYVLQIGEIINIMVNYTDNQTGNFINLATVEITGGGISASMTEFSNCYMITISAENFTQSINFLTIISEKKNYQPQPIEFRIDVIERQTYVSFLLNQINKTLDKTMELPIGEDLNITFKYFDAKTGEYINNATVQLIGTDIVLNLTEYPQLQHYSLQINTQDLGFGVKFLTLVAGKTNYQPSSDALKITVRQIKTNISVISGEVVNIGVGGAHLLNITIYDIDNGVFLTNATVRFSGDLGQGILIEDPDNPGSYQAYFENIGLGTYRITITATESSGYYLFEDNEVTLSATISEGEAMLIWGGLIASIIAAITIGGYFIAYQRVLKYPKPVRKTRKFKRTLKRKSAPSVEITSRDDAFKSLHKEGLGKVSKIKPGKLEDKLPSVDIKSEAKFAEETPSTETQPEDKSTEKSLVSDEKIKKKSDKSKDKTLNKSSKTDN